ncbi:MAG: FixH family protein [Bacteroidetes bacterium]|nr:FixH family protein [Bacteroidota bacterium]
MKTLALLLALIVMSACTSTTEPAQQTTPSDYLLLGTATEGATNVELYAKRQLVVGYNELYIKVIDASTKQVVTNAHVDVDCAMDMDSLHHRAPVEQCGCHEPTVDNMWKVGTVLHMQGSKEAWTVRLNVHNHVRDEEISVSIPVSVAPSSNVATFTSGTHEFIVCFVPPPQPVIGMNAVNFIVYSTSDHTVYTSRDDMSISIAPHMPSMGHGSPGNVQPVSTGVGHYSASVNLIMKGAWVIGTTVTKADEPLGSADFPIAL